MTEWREVRLGDLLKVKHGFAFRGQHFREEGSRILLTPGNFYERGGFKPKNGVEKFYDGPFSSEYLLAAGQVVIAMTEQAAGLLGSSAAIPADDVYLHNQRIGLVIEDPAVAFRGFLYYLFNCPEVRTQIAATATGSKVRHTAPERIHAVRTRVPDVGCQRRIATTLSTFDQLIESNQRRIEILEETARSLYREWFVRYRFPGHEFAEFVDAPVGRVPKNWEVVPFSNAVTINPKLRTPRDKAVGFITMGDVDGRSMFAAPSSTREASGSCSRFENRDTLFARITPCAENGKIAFVQSLDTDEIGAGSTEFIVFRGHRICPEHVYLLAREGSVRGPAIKSMSGASGRQRIQLSCFDSIDVAVPPPNVTAAFEDTVRPMFDAVNELATIGRRVAIARDLLLPKLVTGTIDVDSLGVDDVFGWAELAEESAAAG